MNSLIFISLIVSIYSNEIRSNAVTTESFTEIKSTGEWIPMKSTNQTRGRQIPWTDLIFPRPKLRMEEQKKGASARIDSTSRRSKILGSLAFLAGLSVGGLAGAASSTVKTYAKVPPLALNLDGTRVSPYSAALYDPYPLVTHPYVFAGPFGIYPLFDLSRLQALGNGATMQSGLQSLTQNQLSPQLLSLLDGKRPIDLPSNNEEYMEEDKKAENDKTSNHVEGETDGSAESLVEANRNAEEKTSTSSCVVRQESKKKPNNGKSPSAAHEDLQPDADGSLSATSFRVANTTQNTNDGPTQHRPHKHHHHHHQRNTTQGIPTNETVIPPTNTTENSSTINNQTGYLPFLGYYDGHPQNVDHIDFTTETVYDRYHDYGQVNYNLPYDRPANFYPDERYNYYSNPIPNSYQSSPFQQDQVPEYFPSDLNRLLYTPDNAPQFANGFRPVI